jgi:hypothetical protein
MRLSNVTVSYAPYNRAPVLEDLRLHPPATAIAGGATFRWSVADPDGDPVEVRIEYAAEGSEDWSPAVVEISPPSDDDGKWRAGEGSWDTSEVPEGPYAIRGVCTDRGANHPGDGRETRVAPLPGVTVDRSPPEISVVDDGGAVRVEVTDRHSPVSRLEVVGDGSPAFRVRPEDGVCDSTTERFEIARGDLDLPGPVVLRAFDSAGNSAERELPAR